MRPGPEGPGCGRWWTGKPRPWRGFNEAGAGRPRMQRRRTRAMLARECFNEAGAGRPRMLLQPRSGIQVVVTASMRPGPEGPGCHAVVAIPDMIISFASMRPGPEGPGCSD